MNPKTHKLLSASILKSTRFSKRRAVRLASFRATVSDSSVNIHSNTVSSWRKTPHHAWIKCPLMSLSWYWVQNTKLKMISTLWEQLAFSGDMKLLLMLPLQTSLFTLLSNNKSGTSKGSVSSGDVTKNNGTPGIYNIHT